MARLVLFLFMFSAVLMSAVLGDERKVALVIGNGSYLNSSPLSNPANDATDLAAALRRIGFAVTEQLDLDGAGMRSALREFHLASVGADVALVYYAGHGIELDHVNYLIPVDANLMSQSDVRFEGVPLDLVAEAVSGATTLRLVLLDACRNNPFVARLAMETGRAIQVGLAALEPTGGTVVAYAARSGTVAMDGAGRNSPFMKGLLAHIEEPGLDISLLFRKVRDSVLEETANLQEPFTYGSLPGRAVYLVPPAEVAPQPETASFRRQVVVSAAENEAWNFVKTSTNRLEVEGFIFAYPRSVYLEEAIVLMRSLAQPDLLVPRRVPSVAADVEVPLPGASAAEQDAWDFVKAATNRLQVQGFIFAYPRSIYLEDAIFLMRSLPEPAPTSAPQVASIAARVEALPTLTAPATGDEEEEAWIVARNSGDRSVVERFMFAFPRGARLEDAVALLQSLAEPNLLPNEQTADIASGSEIVPRDAILSVGTPAEETAWTFVAKSTNRLDLQNFIFAFPRGVHLEEAIARYQDLPAVELGPRDQLPLPGSDDLVSAIQMELATAGCGPGPIDGRWGRQSRDALLEFTDKAHIYVWTSQPTRDVLIALLGHRDVSCRDP